MTQLKLVHASTSRKITKTIKVMINIIFGIGMVELKPPVWLTFSSPKVKDQGHGLDRV